MKQPSNDVPMRPFRKVVESRRELGDDGAQMRTATGSIVGGQPAASLGLKPL